MGQTPDTQPIYRILTSFEQVATLFENPAHKVEILAGPGGKLPPSPDDPNTIDIPSGYLWVQVYPASPSTTSSSNLN